MFSSCDDNDHRADVMVNTYTNNVINSTVTYEGISSSKFHEWFYSITQDGQVKYYLQHPTKGVIEISEHTYNIVNMAKCQGFNVALVYINNHGHHYILLD